jgi:N-acetylglutamate synthase-like GNAT family acetyltransferase
MFRVEQMNPEDFPFAVKLSNTMNWNMTVEDFELALELEPEGCFILQDGSARFGIATTVSFGKVGWFGNLIVKEEARRKGAGSLLLGHALDYLKGKGVKTVGLYAYEHLVQFYKKFGFKVNSEFLVLQGEPASLVTAEILENTQEQEAQAIIEFDTQCFGASRSKLLEHILLNKSNRCYVSSDGDAIAGYGAVKVFGNMAEVGPLVCRKSHVGDALIILESILSQLKGVNVFTCVPSKEKLLLDWLFEAGLRGDFQVARMFLGPAVAANCLYVAESLERG